jgi:hypothetical protein
MASESTEQEEVMVRLPGNLHDWLDERARTQGLDSEELLVQLLTAYQTVTDGDYDEPVIVDAGETDAIEEQIREQFDQELDERLEADLESRLRDQIENSVTDDVEDIVNERVTDEIAEVRDAIQRRFGNRIDSVESEFTEKIEDVRERIIQVKKETDRKAPQDHTHEQFETLGEVTTELETVETELDELREGFDSVRSEHEQRTAEIDETLETVQERLQTVAWVVSDLYEAQEARGEIDAVDRIKRAAAKADVDRAKCENCGEGVSISLLTDPECPHCEATVSNVEPASGFFAKPTLQVASQLESGADSPEKEHGPGSGDRN